MPAKPLIEHLKAIFSEMKRLEGLGFPTLDPESEIKWPRSIPVSQGEYVSVSEKIDIEIAALARRYRQDNPAIKRTYTQKDWQAQLRKAFGPALATLELSDEVDVAAANLKKTIAEKVRRLAAEPGPPVGLAFGTSWLDTPDANLELGPARLEPRADWLGRMLADRRVTKRTHDRLLRRWEGKNQRPRKPSRDEHTESSIIDTIGDYPYVISVTLEGLSREFTQDRAARIARLVLMSAALIWNRPSTALRGLRLAYDDLPTRSTVLWIPPTGMVSASYHARAHAQGHRLSKEEWNEAVSNFQPVFRQVGLVASYIAGKAEAPQLTAIRKLEVALRWMYEGCREDDNLLAVTHFASCLDTLGGGKDAYGILALLKARIGLEAEVAIHVDGYTTRQLVERIYGKGRSQFLHGNTDAHLDDWTELRGFAEVLARRTLVACLVEADRNPAVSDFTV